MARTRFASYNLLNFGQSDSTEERQRIERVGEVIAGLDVQVLAVQVLAVQEIIVPSEAAAGELLAKLAGSVGMECMVEPGLPAVAIGHKLSSKDLYFHVGLMWKPDTPPTPGSFRAFRAGDFWHCLSTANFDLGGTRVAHASHHATPFGRNRRADEMERVVSALTRPDNRPPGMIGLDGNSIAADRCNDDPTTFYDLDWHSGQPWYDDLIYQCEWSYDESGQRRHWVDRRPGEVLYAGGLQDAAALLDAAWTPTVGHWHENDPFGERRIDCIKVTHELHGALVEFETIRTPLALAASDHLPVVLTYDPALIPSGV